MHTPQDPPAAAHVPLAVRWRRARAAYRYLNLATHHVLGFTVKFALLAYFAFAVMFLLLRYAVLPNIDFYKGDIERLASRALGNQVSISRIYASWRGMRPNLFLGDVVLRDAQGAQVLALPSVSATLSWWSVLAGEPRFDSLEVIRPQLAVRRDRDGRIYVAGIALDETGPGDARGGDWPFRQREIIIREGRVDWTDLRRGAPPLALANVNMVLFNHWNAHKFALQATPPASLAQPVDIRADFTHPRFATHIANLKNWKGELFADVRGTDLAAWKAYIDYPFEVMQGRGSVRAWLALDHARLAGFTADVALADVSARLGRALPRLDLASARGRLSAREVLRPGKDEGKPTFGAHGHQVALTDFSLETAAGLKMPATTLTESFTPAAGGRPERLQVSARLIELATLAELAAQLPLSRGQRAMLADFAPRGRLLDFSGQWDGKYPAISSYRIKGKVAGLGLDAQPARAALPATAGEPAQAPTPAIPGFQNLTGSIDASEQGGAFSLDSAGLVLKLPTWFADPDMPLDRLAMRARWSFPAAGQFLFQVESMDFAQGRLKGSLSGQHRMALPGQPGQPGHADFRATLSGFELDRIDRYLPLKTPPHLRQWLGGALEGGVAQDVSLRLRGDLAQFPFRADNAQERARGEFRVAGRIEDGKLNYAPALLAADGKAPRWPQAENINGSIVFDRNRMEIHANTARTMGVALTGVTAVVPDLMSRDMLLDIDGSAGAPLQDLLQYVAATPVLGWIGHFTENTRATGPAKLALKMQLPLARMAESKVQGALQLMGNDVLLFPDLPPLQAALGKIEFTERGVNLNGIGASFAGGPLALTGGSQRDNSILIKLGGTFSADGLRKSFPAPSMQRLAGHFSGSTRYTGSVAVRDRQAHVTVESTLAGLGLDFPAPARKAAPDIMPLRFTLTSLGGGAPAVAAAAAAATTAGAAVPVAVVPARAGPLTVLPAAAPAAVQLVAEAPPARDELGFTLGSAISARYLRQKQGKGAWTVLRGGVGVNVPAPEPDSGMMVNVDMKALNVDQWIDIGSSIAGPRGETAPAAAAGAGAGLAQYIVPDVMAARAAELIVGGRRLHNVVVGASHLKNAWQASIDSRQVSGYVTWNESPTGQGLGKVTARLSSLIIPESAAAEVKDLLESGRSAAATIPALDIVADRFELFNKQLGRLELLAYNAQALAGREWRINRLALANPDGNLLGSGKWVTRDGRSATTLNFGIDIADAGRLLDRFGFPDTLKRGKGKLTGDIAWSGLPYSLDIPSLSGQIQLNLESGQFLKQDPGAAKLLGVLSLQALPRLLKLDFRDVFSEGLAFDGINANAIITKGVLKTDNLKMHGVAATVLMDGVADIANETTNLHVVVIPELNFGTGPLVYALAVNPVIGLGSFLAQLFLRAPMMKALTYQMKIAGPWKAPVVTKLGNPNTAPARPAAK